MKFYIEIQNIVEIDAMLESANATFEVTRDEQKAVLTTTYVFHDFGLADDVINISPMQTCGTKCEIMVNRNFFHYEAYTSQKVQKQYEILPMISQS